ncbi:hypothetical protein FRC01_007271 [Tulasnella sp. 417]|nr:hypothetical protein FRC01_007271 [Tulasnella sp. 417]
MLHPVVSLMMQDRWRSDELGTPHLKGVYRVGLSEQVYRRFDLALQINDGCPVTATYYGGITTCSILNDKDPAPCLSESCEVCDVLRSAFGNMPYGASSRDGTLDGPPAMPQPAGAVGANMASISAVATAATPALGGPSQPGSSTNTGMRMYLIYRRALIDASIDIGSGELRSITEKGKGKARAKGSLRYDPSATTTSGPRAAKAPAGGDPQSTPLPPSPAPTPISKSGSAYPTAAQEKARLGM